MISAICPARAGEFYLIDHGIHTGIIIEKRFIDQVFPELKSIVKSEYYEFSYGEEPFFREKEHNFFGMFKALFLPSKSLVRVVPIDTNPMQLTNLKYGVAQLSINDDLLIEMANEIKKSFKNFILIEHQKDKDRYFFEGSHSYHILNNCNDWTANIVEKGKFNTSLLAKFQASKLFQEIIKNSKNFKFNEVGKEKYLKYLR